MTPPTEGIFYVGNPPHLVTRWGPRQGKWQRVDPRLDLVDHSPTGFGWGYQGSGPAQLALALLVDATQNDELAMRLYQDFKAEFLAQWPAGESWWISRAEILRWVTGV